MVTTARRHGIKLMGRAQQITMQDFNSFDLLLAMDRTNREDLQYMAQNEPRLVHVRLLRDFDPLSGSSADIPDPYFGDPAGFEGVYQIVERACVGLLSALEDE
jgi:protein-tyrosine phosphatase